MQYETQNLQLSCSVLAAAMDGENRIIAIDASPAIYKYSAQGEYINHTNIQNLSAYLYRYGKEAAISHDGKLALLCDTKDNKVLLIDLILKKVLTSFKIEKAPEYAIFSDDDTLFLIANSVGRVSIFKTLSNPVLVKEFATPDGVASAAFSEDLRKVAIATLNKKLFIFDLESNNIEVSYKLEDIAEAICFSLDGSQITLFGRDGNSFILNLKLEKIFRATPFSQWPTHLVHMFESDIVLLGTRSAQLFIYTISKGLCLGEILLDSWGITSISIHQSYLLIGFCDGTLTRIDGSSIIQEALDALKSNNYAKLTTIAAQTPLIFISQEVCANIHNQYKELFAYAPNTEQERKGYDALTSLIVSNMKKKKELLNLVIQSEHYSEFMDSYENGNIALACNSAYEFPLLRQLHEYNQIQHVCFTQISKEISLLETNPQMFQAYKETNTFQCLQCEHNSVPAPEHLQNGYEELQISISSKNYQKIFEIVTQYPVLKQTRLYKRIINYGESLIEKILLLLKTAQIKEALQLVSKLSQFKPFEQTAANFKKQLDMYEQFLKADQTNNLSTLFTIATENPALKTTEIFKKNLLNYKTLYLQLQQTAKTGDVLKVITMLSPYTNIEFFEDKNNSLHKLALISEIKLYAKIGEEAHLLEQYHNAFGWDKEYEHVCQLFNIKPNENIKIDAISKENKAIVSFIVGRRVKRETQEAWKKTLS